MIISAVISAVLAYLLGSINSSIIISKLMGASDIRQHGSGNAGATNTLRVMGKKAAAFVVLGDALKGIIAVYAALLLERFAFGIDDGVSIYTAAVFVMLGHVFPVFFGFRGGKGIMTSIAVIFVLSPAIGGILLAIFVVTVVCFNYISLASVVSSFCYPFLVWWLYNGNVPFIVSAVIISAIAIAKHHTNLARLFKGTESKFIKKKQ